MASALGTTHGAVPLEIASANLNYAVVGDNLVFSGPLYVATPQLLRSFGISQSQINPDTQILTARAGLDSLGNMQLNFGGDGGGGPVGGPQNGPGPLNRSTLPCPPSACVANPVIQYLPQLPVGTSAPNTLITERELTRLHLQSHNSLAGWLISSTGPLTAAQISQARETASVQQMSIETKNDAPNSWEVINWATAAGIALALAILAMTVGLIRSETASDLRTLAATGASSWKRRMITATTAGGLALLGMLLGTAGGYLAGAGYFQHGKFGENVFGNLSHVPLPNLVIIVVGLPLAAFVGGFIFAGREPPLVSRQPIE
jgi:putative ABC transport system permease protein